MTPTFSEANSAVISPIWKTVNQKEQAFQGAEAGVAKPVPTAAWTASWVLGEGAGLSSLFSQTSQPVLSLLHLQGGCDGQMRSDK